MAKKNNYAALEQLHAAAMIAKENKNAMDMIHPEAEKDLAKLLRVLKLPKDFTGEVPYKDYKIRIQRRTIIQFMSK